MFLWFLMSIFGLLFVYRCTFQLQEIHFLSSYLTLKVKIALLLMMIVINYCLRHYEIIHACVIIASMWVPIFVKTCMQAWIVRTWDQQFISFLDSVTAKMKSGVSFRESLKHSSSQQSSVHRRIIEEFLISLQMKQNNFSKYNQTIAEQLLELSAVDRSPHKQVDRLKSLRRKYKIRSDFRKKTKVALAQIKSQSVILSVLYAGLVLFSLFQFGFKEHRSVFLGSFILFSSGSLWLMRAGKAYKWKT